MSIPKKLKRKNFKLKNTSYTIFKKNIISEILFFFREYKLSILLVTLIFIFGIIIGTFLSYDLKFKLMSPILDLIDSVFTTNSTQLFFKIFLNNAKVSLILIPTSFILVGLASLFTNGLIIGILFSTLYSIAPSKLSMLKTFLISILPHGVLELPAIILSASIGFGLFLKLFTLKNNKYSYKTYIKKVPFYLIILIFILFCAGLIESFITPKLIDTSNSNSLHNPNINLLNVTTPNDYALLYQNDTNHKSYFLTSKYNFALLLSKSKYNYILNNSNLDDNSNLTISKNYYYSIINSTTFSIEPFNYDFKDYSKILIFTNKLQNCSVQSINYNQNVLIFNCLNFTLSYNLYSLENKTYLISQYIGAV